MSWRHLNAVWDAHLEPAGLKLVAATLADRADDNGGGIRLTQDAIGKRTSLSGRQVRHWLRELERMTVLVIERRPTQYAPTHYRMPIEALHALPRPEAGFHPDDEPDRKPASAVKESRPEAQRRQTGSAASPDRKPASDKSSLSRKTQRESVPPDALSRAVEPPTGVDAEGWTKLLKARPDLDPVRLAEQALHHLAAGCPLPALSTAMNTLRLTPAFKDLMPKYRHKVAAKPKANFADVGEKANGNSHGAVKKANGSATPAPTKAATNLDFWRERNAELRQAVAAGGARAATALQKSMFANDSAKTRKWLAVEFDVFEAAPYVAGHKAMQKLGLIHP